MFGLQRIVIAQYERGLMLRNRTVKSVLMPGIYWMFDPLKRSQVQTFNLAEEEFIHPQLDFMLKLEPELCAQHFEMVELNSHQVGLLYLDGVLSRILAPGTRSAFWKAGKAIQVEVLDIETEPQIPERVARLLIRTRNKRLLHEVRDAVYAACIEENSRGLLYIDGELKGTLKAGTYGFWRFNRDINVKQIDSRVQLMEVSGQEILSKDKVSLRVNLSAQYQVKDPVLAETRLSDFKEFFYRELQLSLRQVIGTRSLDALLMEKDALGKSIIDDTAERMAEFGLLVQSIGVKDIILPGEMKTLLNQVVEAEKTAQANVIKRREETAATRSLLNTAKLMDDNPILLRLKELEALEKISEKVERLTVYGGLDGVLNDTLSLKLPS